MEYRPLNVKGNEIRVLRFVYDRKELPSAPVADCLSDPLRCIVKHVSLDDTKFTRHRHATVATRSNTANQSVLDYIDSRDSHIETSLSAFSREFIARHEYSSSISCSKLRHKVARQATMSNRYSWGDFEALSYTWGDSECSCEIIVNNISIRVRKNLALALFALRGLPESRAGMHFWVDNLCIDQKNQAERESQVRKMPYIYEKARSVVAWLGGEHPAQDKAVFLLYKVFEWVWNLRNRRKYKKRPYSFLPFSMNPEYGDALLDFLNNPYWQRLWIIQELAMNHHSTLFIYGKHYLSRVLLREALVFCRELLEGTIQFSKFGLQQQRDFHSLSSQVVKILSLMPQCDGYGLDHLMILISKSRAQDPRDKIYGILGLLPPALAANITPSYSSSADELYKYFAQAIVKHTGQLDLLFCWKTGHVDQNSPSWMPDWRFGFDRKHIKSLRRFRPNGTNTGSIHFRIVSETLFCEGTEIGFVKNCSHTFPADSEMATRNEDRIAAIEPHQYPKDHLRDALSQTILLGHPGGAGTPSVLDIPWEILSGSPSEHIQNSVSNLYLYQNDISMEEFHKFRIANRTFQIFGQQFESFFPRSGTLQKDFWSRLYLATRSLHGRRIITTTSGLIGLAPGLTQMGDVIATILGCSFPVVLRRSGPVFKIIGECYVHGIMRGEGFELRKVRAFQIQ